MASMAETKWHVRYISYFKIFCKEKRCVTYAAEGVPLLFDISHITKDGSILFARHLRESGDLP